MVRQRSEEASLGAQREDPKARALDQLEQADLGDPGALAGALARVLDDPARARELGERARARAVERYDLTRLVAEEIELLKRLARSDR